MKSNLLPIVIGGVILAVVIYLFLKKSATGVATAPGQVPGQFPVGQPCKLSDNSQGVIGPNGQCVTQSDISAVTSGLTALLNPAVQAGTTVYTATK